MLDESAEVVLRWPRLWSALVAMASLDAYIRTSRPDGTFDGAAGLAASGEVIIAVTTVLCAAARGNRSGTFGSYVCTARRLRRGPTAQFYKSALDAAATVRQEWLHTRAA